MNRQQRRARKIVTEPSTHVVDTLSDQEAAILRMIEAELARLALLHGALSDRKLRVMQDIVLGRGGTLEENYTIDLERALLLKLDPEEAPALEPVG